MGPADPLIATRDQGFAIDLGLGVHLPSRFFVCVGGSGVLPGTLDGERFRERYAEGGFAEFEPGDYPSVSSRADAFLGLGYEVRLGAWSLAPAITYGRVRYYLSEVTLLTKRAGANAFSKLEFSPEGAPVADWAYGARLELRMPLLQYMQAYADASVTRTTTPVRYRIDETDLLTGASSETCLFYPAPDFPIALRVGLRLMLRDDGRIQGNQLPDPAKRAARKAARASGSDGRSGRSPSNGRNGRNGRTGNSIPSGRGGRGRGGGH